MGKYDIIEVGGEEVLCNFMDKSTIEHLLIFPENRISLFRRDLKTNEIVKDNDFQNKKHLLTLEAIIEAKGYEIHTFDECVELYGDVFENDDSYLPFDNDEVYITLKDRYEGCCTRGGWEFTTKDYHYFFGIITNFK